MPSPWDQIAVALCVAAAVAYLWRESARKRRAGGCRSCDTGCATPEPETPQLIQLEIPPANGDRRAS
jgi:hypothetical protein